jgi:hypothetical protein
MLVLLDEAEPYGAASRQAVRHQYVVRRAELSHAVAFLLSHTRWAILSSATLRWYAQGNAISITREVHDE